MRYRRSPAPAVEQPVEEPAASPCLPTTSDFQSGLYVREDWTLFRSIATLCQKAGVPENHLGRLVVKELADNALDEGAHASVRELPDGRVEVVDDGPGIPGSDVEVAELFSFRRPLSSSKLLRLPKRGCLGNGLRCVAGAVLAGGGSLEVTTRGRTLGLQPTDAGTTQVVWTKRCNLAGTRIVIGLGRIGALDEDVTGWAHAACQMGEHGSRYVGKPSPHWYDDASFFELCQASGTRSAREVAASLDGCSGARAGTIAAAFKNREARSLSRLEARSLLDTAREHAKSVRPDRLGGVGRNYAEGSTYQRRVGTFTVAGGEVVASIPYVVECWAWVDEDDESDARLYVNRTPVTTPLATWTTGGRERALGFEGCGLNHEVRIGRKAIQFIVNVDAPFIPITSDGKSPNLAAFDEVTLAIGAAVSGARRGHVAGDKDGSKKQRILDALPAGIAKASSDGEYRFNLRNLYYVVRDEMSDPTLAYGYFSKVVTEYEDSAGDIPGIYRDDRGSVYTPHSGEVIPLGTKSVETYERPAWRYNKVLYCEKEGFISILREARFPERHDCVLFSSKGFATRAARDFLDLLGETDEETTVFCLHDADGPGTSIFEKLQEGTTARPARRVTIINLGLEPEEALAMGLEPETLEEGNRTVPVAAYVNEEWRDWLQTHRIELNAMTTAQLIDWLDAKMEEYDGKVVPPTAVMCPRLEEAVAQRVREDETRVILEEAGLDDRVAARVATLAPKVATAARRLERTVRAALRAEPEESWSDVVDRVAQDVASDGRS
jgi:hypothetical protein